ncbi:MAG: hypothetical protein COA38_20550 [Fluviicola sp.]|nr:MAG: hypothetical protein COA38_20550 [Fluviicola sp.]
MSQGLSVRAARAERARRACYRSLKSYAYLIWPIVNPDRKLEWSWHMDALCLHLEAWLRGDVPRLMINLPPGHSKSFLVSIAAPTFAWLTKPSLRFICASYGMELATDLNEARRLVLDSDVYREYLNPGWEPQAGRWLKTYFVNNKRGYMRASSTKTGILGGHADKMIIDDPLRVEDIYGPPLKGHVSWFTDTASTRFGDLKSASVCIVMQRIHVEDLSGYLLELEPERWCHLCLPAEFDPERRCSTDLGWTDPRKVKGELLCPDRFPDEVLAPLKAKFGSNGGKGWYSQYQQDPAKGSGRMFNTAWWQEYDVLPDKIDAWVVSIDASFGEKKDAKREDDFNATMVGARCGNRLYLVDCRHARAEFNEFKAFLFGELVDGGERHARDGFADKWIQVPTWLVEQAANGAATVSELKRMMPRSCSIHSINPTDSKQARAAVTAPLVESGHILVPKGAAWVKDFIEEAGKFPNTTHNDRVDALTQMRAHFGALLGISAFRPEVSKPPTEAAAMHRRWGGIGQAR